MRGGLLTNTAGVAFPRRGGLAPRLVDGAAETALVGLDVGRVGISVVGLGERVNRLLEVVRERRLCL